ncbi:MAG: protein arginine kinase [Candidatus Omnitrophota bacterium]
MFEEFLDNKDGWLNGKGPQSDVIISSRMRLARNIDNFPFPRKADVSQKREIIEMVKENCRQLNPVDDVSFVNMDEVVDLDKQFLLERHLISHQHAQSAKGRGFCSTASEVFSIMVNEEDHLRMQVIMSGFDLKNAWEMINSVDDELSRRLVFSFSSQFGYLTSCPTNVGTGLRASCMLHLPALVLTKRMNKILEFLTKLSFATRGLFGEGTHALGNFFQISNQASLGLSEEEIIDNLSGVVNQVKEQEMVSREILLKKYRHSFEDSVWRSLGILSNCRLISSKEALSHLSMLCIGTDLGIIKGIDREVINTLFINIQPAHLQKIESKVLSEKERDYIRALVLRRSLKENSAQ